MKTDLAEALGELVKHSTERLTPSSALHDLAEILRTKNVEVARIPRRELVRFLTQTEKKEEQKQ